MKENVKKVPLGKLAEFKSGGTPRKSNKDYWSGDLPWVSAKDLKSLEVVDSIDHLSPTGFAAAKIAPDGSLLILVRGMTLHKDVPVCLAGRDVAFNQDIKALIVSEKISSKYLLYFLHSRKNRLLELVDSAGHGTGRLNTDSLKAFPVLVPPISVQVAIADLLSTWDEAIEKTERLIQAKERRFQWLLRDTMSDSAKGNINNGRKKVAIGSFLTESRIPDTVNDPNKRLTVRLHLKGVEARDVRGTESSDATAYFIRKSGQLVYGKQNIFRGAVGIIPPELDGYASTQDIPAFYIDNTVDQDWLLFLFSYPGFYKKLEIYASGSGSKRLHSKDLFKIHISIPNLEAQKKLADGLSLARSEIDFLKDLTDRYKSQKRGLMQKLLTGQWRVRVDKEVA